MVRQNYTLKYKLTVLKYNLCDTPVKRRQQKKGYKRKLINRKFSI